MRQTLYWNPGGVSPIESKGVGVGSRGMRERVRYAQGELTVDSNALGTKITAVFSIKNVPRENKARIHERP